MLASEPVFEQIKARQKVYPGTNAPVRFNTEDGELFLAKGTVRLVTSEGVEEPLVEATDYRVSPDGKKLLFTNNLTGSDAPEWRVYDILARKTLSDKPIRIRWNHIKCNETSDGLYYTQWPSRAVEETWRDLRVRRYVPLALHKLGSETDEVIFDSPETKTSMIFSAVKPVQDNALLVYRQFGSGTPTPMYWGEKEGQGYRWTMIQGSDDPRKSGSMVGKVGNEAIFKTAECGNPYCLMALLMEKPFKKRLFLPIERQMVLDGATFVGQVLIVTYIDRNFLIRVRVFGRDGKLRKEFSAKDLGFPPRGTFSGFSGNLRSKYTDFTYSSANFPAVTVRMDLGDLSLQKIPSPKPHPLLGMPVEVRLAEYTSLDGVRVPIHVYTRTDLGTEKPKFAFLFYYGALGANYLPSYSARMVAALELGGIVAVANVRGGGERGYNWYRSGSIDKSQTIMDIAGASRWLKRTYEIQNNTVIAEGGSWGGLHTYLALIRYPQDFSGFISLVPVSSLPYSFTSSLFGWLIPDDMFAPRHRNGEHVRFDKFLKHSEQWSALEQVSKMSSIKPILTLNVANDERVGPESARLMVAALKRKFGEEAPIYLAEERSGGHSGGNFLPHEMAFIARLAGVTKIRPLK